MFLFLSIFVFSLEAPQLQLESPKRLHIIEGMDLHLDARVQGYPFPRVTWIHGENLLKSTPNVDSETSLKIRNVTASESGNYTCLAENLFGRVFFTVNVYVKGIDLFCREAIAPGE